MAMDTPHTPRTKPVYQVDHAGLFVCTTEADESPLEPGVWHLPAGTIETPPPEQWPADRWPRWNGHAWQLVPRPAAAPQPEMTPAQKLAAFLQANPDVQSLIG